MPTRKPQPQKSRIQFYDVIPASWLKQHPIAGTLAQRDLKAGNRIKMVGVAIGGSNEALATITSGPVKAKNNDYQIEVVLDAHFSTVHSDRPNGTYSKCCYQAMSLRSLGVLPNSDGTWDYDRYVIVAPSV